MPRNATGPKFWAGTFTLEHLKTGCSIAHLLTLCELRFYDEINISGSIHTALPTLHIHLDESGDLNFSPAGTPFYIFACAWTYDPAPLATELNELRFTLIKQGFGDRLSGFHASADAKPKRELVTQVLSRHKNWNFAGVVIDKRKVNPKSYEPEMFYPKFCSIPLRFVFKSRVKPGTATTLIYTDTLPFTGKRAEAATIAIKSTCRKALPDISFHVLHHRRESNAWIQVADYCCWSLCRKWERNDLDLYLQLRPRLADDEIDPTSRGDGTRYY